MDRSPGARLRGDLLFCNHNVDQGEHRQREYQQACAKEKEIPEEVLCEITEIIWNKIDKEEKKWRYPRAAYEIANEYCAENFS